MQVRGTTFIPPFSCRFFNAATCCIAVAFLFPFHCSNVQFSLLAAFHRFCCVHHAARDAVTYCSLMAGNKDTRQSRRPFSSQAVLFLFLFLWNEYTHRKGLKWSWQTLPLFAFATLIRRSWASDVVLPGVPTIEEGQFFSEQPLTGLTKVKSVSCQHFCFLLSFSRRVACLSVCRMRDRIG